MALATPPALAFFLLGFPEPEPDAIAASTTSALAFGVALVDADLTTGAGFDLDLGCLTDRASTADFFGVILRPLAWSAERFESVLQKIVSD